jgi:hypothetical protein
VAAAGVQPRTNPSMAPTVLDVSVNARQRKQGGARRALSTEDMVLLTYYLLGTGATLELTAYYFGISVYTASSVFVTTLNVLDRWFAVEMPPMDAAVAEALTPPEVHARFGMVRPVFVVDGTEMSAPSAQDPAVYRANYSLYKHMTTAKASVLVHAVGGFVSVSDMFTGCTGDDALLAASSQLACLPAGSLLLADRGYTRLPDLALRLGLAVETPDFRVFGHQQASADSVDASASVANVRVIVENTIRAAKGAYDFFTVKREVGQLDVLTPAFRVACMTLNFRPPLRRVAAPAVEAVTATKRRRMSQAATSAAATTPSDGDADAWLDLTFDESEMDM